jgi:hypothetical protein
MQYASNIVYTNGNLDPWSPAGVVKTPAESGNGDGDGDGETNGSILSLTIDMGGHHLDLFWPTVDDPQSGE